MREIKLEKMREGAYALTIGDYPHGLTEAEVLKLHHVCRLKKNPTKLPYNDWDKLDDLLGKHGFGGYYDLVECLKHALHALTVPSSIRDKEGDMIDIDDDPELKTLPQVVFILDTWSNLIANWAIHQFDTKGVDFAEEVWKYEHKRE